MPGKERRKTERLMLSIPIRVLAFSSSGGFTEDSSTIQVNRDGARIVLRHRVAMDDSLRIINLQNHAEADFRVVGRARLDQGKTAEWGVECQEPGRNIWGIEFPPPVGSGDPQASALLRCQGCGQQVLDVLSLVEVDLLETAGALPRRCDRCQEFSSWVYVEIDQPVAEVPKPNPEPDLIDDPAIEPALTPPPPELGPERGGIERRAYRRLPIKLPVLVKAHGGESEVSKTENVSKGGIAVCLNILLEVGETVTMICPYTAGDQTLEQKAEVRRRALFIAGERWLYGLRYMK